jgi:hypothetical protein
MPRIRRHIARACDGMDSERTLRKRDAGLQYQRDAEDRTGIGGNGGVRRLGDGVSRRHGRWSTQAPGVARSTASNVAGSVNELSDGTRRSVDAAIEAAPYPGSGLGGLVNEA